MQRIKEFLCDGKSPTDDELKEAIQIAEQENCLAKLLWHYPYSGWHHLYIQKGMTFEECKDKLPKVYYV